MPTSDSQTQDVLDILAQARNAVRDLLTDNPRLQLIVDSKLTPLINQLSHITGNKTIVETRRRSVTTPLTEFMGEPIVKREKVTKTTLTPKQEEVNSFKAKVDKLDGEFENLSNEQIIDAYSKVDMNVVRGLAKLAGVENFKERAIDNAFLEEIRDARRQREEALKGVKEANESVEDQENIAD